VPRAARCRKAISLGNRSIGLNSSALKLSAVIPTYNRRTHVLRAIDSVLAQTAPVDEIIVVDDGSTDGTSDAIRNRFGGRVAVLGQKNSGVSAARNHGIREARGEWIALLDSDDVWLPTKIERQLEALATFGDEFGVCFTDCVYEGHPDIKLSNFEATGFGDAPTFGVLESPAQCILEEREPFCTPSFLIRRSLFDEIDCFDEAAVIKEDTDVIFRLGFKTRFCFVSEKLVCMDRTISRTDGLSEICVTRDDRKYRSMIRVYSKWLSLPEVRGSEYERPVRDTLTAVYFDSVEAKIHELKLTAALREVRGLRQLGKGYVSIIATLLSRKLAKVRRRFKRSIATAATEGVVNGATGINP